MNHWVCEYKIPGGRKWHARDNGRQACTFATYSDAQAWLCGLMRYPHERFRNTETGEIVQGFGSKDKVAA